MTTAWKTSPSNRTTKRRTTELGFGLLLVTTAAAMYACTGASSQPPSEPVRSVAAPGLTPVEGSALDASGQPDAGAAFREAAAASAPVGLARGTGTAADKALHSGDEAYLAERWGEARRAYEQAAQLAPKDPAPIVGLVRVALSSAGVPTDHAAAPDHPILHQTVTSLQKAINLDRSYGPAHLELGRALLVMDKAKEAVRALRQAVRLSQHDPEAHSALGVALLATGKGRQAVEALRRAIELDPHDVDRKVNLGTALLLRGRAREAIRLFESAIETAPQDGRLRTNLGTAYLSAQEPDKALPHLRKAVELEPDRATFRSNLGYALQLRKNHEAAIEQYRKAIELEPKLGSAWINLGTALAQTGNLDEARKAFERAIEIDPTDPRPRSNLRELDEVEADAGTPGRP